MPQYSTEKFIFLSQFTSQPESGDRFRGEILDIESNGKVYISLPGLNEDEIIGVIKPEDHKTTKSIRIASIILCEVIEVKPDRKPGTYLVYCKAV